MGPEDRPGRQVEELSSSGRYPAKEGLGRRAEPQAQLSGARPELLVLDLLAGGMAVEIPVTGDSMSPSIRSSDTLTLAPIGERRVSLGDVVAFARPDGRLVIHRVVAIAEDRLRTRGDAASQIDAWIDRDSLIGRVEGVSRRGRRARRGLGPGRSLIAALSRAGLLRHLLRPWRWWARSWHQQSP